MTRSFLSALAALLTACVAHASDTPAAARGLLLDAAVAGTNVIAVGERGTIVRSPDSGHTWEQMPSPTGATLTALAFASEEKGWAVGHDGTILYSRDGGHSWLLQHSDTSVSFLDVLAIDIRHAIAVGAFGACFTTEDGGNTWKPQRVLEEDLHLNRIVSGHEGSLLIAGEQGTLLRRAHGAASFSPMPADYEGSFFGVLPFGKDGLLAYGLRGRVFRKAGRDDTWTPVPLAEPASIASGVQLKSGLLVLGGQARQFFVSRDGGASFQAWRTPLTTGVSELIEAPDGTVLAVGEAGATRLPSPE